MMGKTQIILVQFVQKIIVLIAEFNIIKGKLAKNIKLTINSMYILLIILFNFKINKVERKL